MYLIRVFDGDEVWRYFEYDDGLNMLKKIQELVNLELPFTVHVCKCALDLT